MTPKPKISLVVPCLNECATVGPFFKRVQIAITQPYLREFDFEFLFIDDGSTDSTLVDLVKESESDSRIVVVELSRNFGKEAALSAGIDIATGDAVIPIDVDLQDPPELIPQLVEKWMAGFDVVLARRKNRTADAVAKRWSARLFYWLHNRLSAPSLPENIGDFRLMDRIVVEQLKRLPERRRFMKGLFAWVGFRTAIVEYDRAPRSAGDTKFNAWQLWNLALEGITSFSTVPLRAWTYLGLAVSLVSLAYGAYIVFRTLVFGVDLPGYASLLTAILFLGGLQLVSLGVIGEYVGRTYEEAKGRPVYIVRHIYRLDTLRDATREVERTRRVDYHRT